MKHLPIYLSMLTLSILFNSCNKVEPEEVEPIKEEQATLDENVKAIIPHIYIQIANDEEVVVKDVYLSGEVEIKGQDIYPSLQKVTTRIKGRGNSTWGKPKKPYRLKLDKAASVLGLTAAKDWVLLANYQDYTFMCNAIAMKMGQQLGMPFTNSIIPVDVTINGKYRGSYMLTQQVEAKEGRVNVGPDGQLLELDTNFDEDFQFKSSGWNLPVMIKFPDITSDEQFNSIKNGFENLEQMFISTKFPNNDYGKIFDKQQFVNYILVNNLTANYEINHPKSVYMHKLKDGKYTMGPLWDFDWGFGMEEEGRKYFNFETLPLFKPTDARLGHRFFTHILKDPEIKQLYKQTWENYKANHFEALMSYIEEYAAKIRESQKKDFEIWKVGPNNHAETKKNMKVYLRKRAQYLDSYIKQL